MMSKTNTSTTAAPAHVDTDDHGGRRVTKRADSLVTHLAGTKKAVLVGITYQGGAPYPPLLGAGNDVRNMNTLLGNYFGFGAIEVLVDDYVQDGSDALQRCPVWPTRQNILAAIDWLVQGAKAGDSLVFFYSGHGGRVQDFSQDELDGFDEAIVPWDAWQNGFLVDDDLHRALIAPLPKGVRLTVIIDACHSGTALDLPFVYQFRAGATQPELFTSTRPSTHLHPDDDGDHENTADVIALTSCRDDQTSADTRVEALGGTASGAMTYALLQSMFDGNGQRKANVTYWDLLVQMRAAMKKGGLDQVPQLAVGRVLDLNTPFAL
ncbi:Ca(2+)-dependent cysteine protease [Allomyces javanicus]|nr:Ca(2+)-dependent cysteine protease [Allomyces javanicus]